MTDAEINLAIAKIEYQELVIGLVGDEVEILTDPNDDIKFVDYCNNWEDIGPIIEREKITVDFWDYKQWIGHNNGDTPFVKTKAETPMKAAALCYLKMRGVSDD